MTKVGFHFTFVTLGFNNECFFLATLLTPSRASIIVYSSCALGIQWFTKALTVVIKYNEYIYLIYRFKN